MHVILITMDGFQNTICFFIQYLLNYTEIVTYRVNQLIRIYLGSL